MKSLRTVQTKYSFVFRSKRRKMVNGPISSLRLRVWQKGKAVVPKEEAFRK